MPSELEIKLRVTDSALSPAQVREELQSLLSVPEFTRYHLHNIYFDTPGLALHHAKSALRLREKGGKWWQTFKTQGVVVDGLHRRGEWEWPVAGRQLDSQGLLAVDAWPERIAVQDLVAIFETNFDRDQANVVVQDAEIEVVLDVGEIISGGEHAAIYELELELVAGREQSLLQLGKKLQQYLPVEAYDRSKAERGYALYGGGPA